MTRKPHRDHRRRWDLPPKIEQIKVPLAYAFALIAFVGSIVAYTESHYVAAGDFAQYQKRQDANWRENEIRVVQRDLREVDNRIFQLEVKADYKRPSPLEKKLLEKYKADREFMRKDLMRLKGAK